MSEGVDSIVSAMVVDSLVRALVPTTTANQHQQLLEQTARDMLAELAKLEPDDAAGIYDALLHADDLAATQRARRLSTARVFRRWWETMNGKGMP